MKDPETPPRDTLNALFRRALASVRADRLAEMTLAGEDFTHVIALGKAGEALAAGAWRASSSPVFPRGPTAVRGKGAQNPQSTVVSHLHRYFHWIPAFAGMTGRLHSRVSPDSSARRSESGFETGFLAIPRGYATGELPAEAPFARHVGAHPIPDETSLEAGAALLQFVDALPSTARVAVLVSGGVSASVEVPVAGMDLAFLQRANRWLLASGLPIADINRVRTGLSRLKGGGLAPRLSRVDARAWVLSDVGGGALEWVGGGLLAPLPSGSMPPVPAWLQERLAPSPADNNVPSLPLTRLAGNAEAVAAVAEQGAHMAGSLDGDAEDLGRRIGGRIVNAEPGCYVWGGEPTVRLPDKPGRGGRCQQLALAAAVEIAGRDDCFLLAASTDGWDGPEPVAGACVDGGTIARGEGAGLDAGRALEGADAGSFLGASGDLIRTGPTGTHVNDLVIVQKC